MTPIDRFERQLPSALADLGETRTPDYLPDILGRTARTRQRPAWASLDRWLPVPAPVSPRLVLVLVGMALAVVITGVLAVRRPVVPTGSRCRSATVAIAPVAEGTVPAELVGRWMGGPRDISGIHAGSGASILFEPSAVSVNGASSNQDPRSMGDVTVVEPGTIELTGPADGCDPTAVGRYRWSVSETGLTLTLESDGADGCPSRGETLPGTWQHMGCKDPANNCLGDMDAGEQASQFFTPLVPPGAP